MQLLEGLWEIRFSVADSAELFADVVVAGCDADTAAFSRDADCDPWLVSVMSTSEPDEMPVSTKPLLLPVQSVV